MVAMRCYLVTQAALISTRLAGGVPDHSGKRETSSRNLTRNPFVFPALLLLKGETVSFSDRLIHVRPGSNTVRD